MELMRKRGNWIDGYSGSLVTIECDQCKYTNVYKEKPLWKPNYCPNCGAVMNGTFEYNLTLEPETVEK